jgi:hypothetical protein
MYYRVHIQFSHWVLRAFSLLAVPSGIQYVFGRGSIAKIGKMIICFIAVDM